MSRDRALMDRIVEHVGATGQLQMARHPIGRSAIADWCDAIGDQNPNYVDGDAAASSIHHGIVAPPAMLDVWDRGGLGVLRSGEDPRSAVMALLDAGGFVGVVAVNSDLSLERYLRPDETLSNIQILEEVSAEKHTALGIGHFVTTRHRYQTASGEHVGDLCFRILKFKPGTGRVPAAPPASVAATVDPNPALRPRPAINRDNEFLWGGYRAHELRIQSCAECGALAFPPTPRCPTCGSFERSYVLASGQGTLYSFATPHYPQIDGFSYPLQVGLVELAEGTRIVANVIGLAADQLRIGMPLELEWLDTHPGLLEGATDSRGTVSIPQFRPATPVPRVTTVHVEELRSGIEFPPWVVPVTPTLIVSGALATRDFQEVHHDRDLAIRRGSKDIFLNINTSVGLMQRYVTDVLGPNVLISALRTRLGAPAYPYDPLTFTGEISSLDPLSGLATISVRAQNSLGDHVSGSVDIVVPGGSSYPHALTRGADR